MPDIIENMNEKNWSGGAAWMWGNLMPTTEAALPVTDWGLTHSDITYDVVHVWDGRFFRLDDYLTRFKAVCKNVTFLSTSPVKIYVVYCIRFELRLHRVIGRTGSCH